MEPDSSEDFPDIAFWRPRVVRHVGRDGTEAFAIHEVTFTSQGLPNGATEDALSPRCASPAALKDWLLQRLEGPDDAVVCGDNGYSYEKTHLRRWLQHIDEPAIDFDAL